MSKAFTREETGAPEQPLVPRPTGESPVTPEGLHALQEELARLNAQPPAEGADAEARARRVAQLEALVASARVVEPPQDTSEAAFGLWVEVEDEDGARQTYRLVGPLEADARERRLSVESPLGRALLGHAVGDTVTVERPRGALELTLLWVGAQPRH